MLKLTKFKYTKDNGDVSERTVVITVEPTKNLSGIDISEMEDHSQIVALLNELEAANKEHLEKLKELYKKYDVQYRYRQFKPENISNREELEW